MFSELMISFITGNLVFQNLRDVKGTGKKNQLLVRVHLLKQEAGAITSILERK